MSHYGQSGPKGFHSVMTEPDYVGVQHAVMLGAMMEYAVAVQNSGVNIRLHDPRIGLEPRYSCTIADEASNCCCRRPEVDCVARNRTVQGMAEQMSGASSVGDARESDARDDTCRSKNIEGVLGSTEKKPHLTVRFHNFVQTLTPEKVQAFEILRGHELNGMMQCAVQPMVDVDNCGRSVDRPLHGTVKELIPNFVKDASVRMGGPQVAEQGNSEDATGPCTYATKNAAECFGPRSGRRVIRLEEAVPAPRQISTCVIPDMVDYLTEGHSMSDLHVDCPMVHELPPKEKDVCLQSMCKQKGSDKFSCVHVFTDGAFDEKPHAGRGHSRAMVSLRRNGIGWVSCQAHAMTRPV